MQKDGRGRRVSIAVGVMGAAGVCATFEVGRLQAVVEGRGDGGGNGALHGRHGGHEALQQKHKRGWKHEQVERQKHRDN